MGYDSTTDYINSPMVISSTISREATLINSAELACSRLEATHVTFEARVTRMPLVPAPLAVAYVGGMNSFWILR